MYHYLEEAASINNDSTVSRSLLMRTRLHARLDFIPILAPRGFERELRVLVLDGTARVNSSVCARL